VPFIDELPKNELGWDSDALNLFEKELHVSNLAI